MGKITFMSTRLRCWALISIFSISTMATGQEIHCNLTQISSESIAGTCTGIIPPTLQLLKSSGSSDVIWEGSASEGGLIWPLDIAAIQTNTSDALLVRYEMGWFFIDDFSLTGSTPKLVWNMSNKVGPSAVDIEILNLALSKLNNGSNWNRADNRNCADDSQLLSLYCALTYATTQLMGKPYHRQPAIQVIREIIGARWPERFSDHRLMDFNNNQASDFNDINILFREAQDTIASLLR